MSLVFLDTVGLLAIWDKSDQWHSGASTVFEQLLNEGRSLVTTPHVLLECGNASARRSFRIDVCLLRQSLLDNDAIIQPTEQEERLAWLEYERYGVGQAGIVDCISFVVMRGLGIQEVFSCDKHFATAGFKLLF